MEVNFSADNFRQQLTLLYVVKIETSEVDRVDWLCWVLLAKPEHQFWTITRLHEKCKIRYEDKIIFEGTFGEEREHGSLA